MDIRSFQQKGSDCSDQIAGSRGLKVPGQQIPATQPRNGQEPCLVNFTLGSTASPPPAAPDWTPAGGLKELLRLLAHTTPVTILSII